MLVEIAAPADGRKVAGCDASSFSPSSSRPCSWPRSPPGNRRRSRSSKRRSRRCNGRCGSAASPRASWSRSTSRGSRSTRSESTRRSRSIRARSRTPTRATPSARAGRVRGPLHGIPIALKDNIHTVDIPTTGGALAFADFMPPYDATLTKNLRDAGAVIIAKTVLTELANWVAGAPTPMPGNYSAVGGFAFNPVRSARRIRARSSDGAAGAEHRRLQLRRRHRRQFLGRQRRHRHGRLDRESRDADDARRDQADDRPDQPARRSCRSPPTRTRRVRWRGR